MKKYLLIVALLVSCKKEIYWYTPPTFDVGLERITAPVVHLNVEGAKVETITGGWRVTGNGNGVTVSMEVYRDTVTDGSELIMRNKAAGSVKIDDISVNVTEDSFSLVYDAGAMSTGEYFDIKMNTENLRVFGNDSLTQFFIK